jgi:UDP-3-O-[3-hydroxymyristoyl] glucosamine N-acyltransferase
MSQVLELLHLPSLSFMLTSTQLQLLINQLLLDWGKNRCRKLCRPNVKIGENAILYPNVTILDECTIGKILYYGLGQWSENVVTLVQIALYI